MITGVAKNIPDIQVHLAELKKVKNQVETLMEQFQSMLVGPEGLQVILPELHEEANGRIDARKLAAYMGVPLKRFAEGLRLNYKAVHRNPSAEAFQSPLKVVKRSLGILHEFFNKPETVRVWLNTPHPDLDGRTALEMILANNPNAVMTILENAAAGVPV
jgi:hypothetical protein